MSSTKLTRRALLRASAMAAGVAALGACTPAPAPTKAPEPTAAQAEPTPVAEPTAGAAEQVVLEICAGDPENLGWSRQIWDVYEDENPGVKIELFIENEDTMAAFRAKVAGGYVPAFGPAWLFVDGSITTDNAEEFVDLTEIPGIPWEKYTHDPRKNCKDLFGFNPRGISPFRGFIWTWMYHKELMERAELNPREEVKTFEDLKAWIQKGTDWVKTQDDLDYFWDACAEPWTLGAQYLQTLTLAFPNGNVEDLIACWTGEKPVNGPDSPFRTYFEFWMEANAKGWVPENYWTRNWETDMESSYIARKSVCMLHGPWPWDKAVAADPSVQQLGFPAAPPAAGQQQWTQWIYQPDYANGFCIPIKAMDLPAWPEIQKAFAWWNDEEAIAMRAEAMGQEPYFEGLKVEFDTPQYNGVTKEIATPGGLWENVKYNERWFEVEQQATRKPGTPGILDWEAGALMDKIPALMKGELTLDAFLDWAQANRDASYQPK